ncbi:unnamed protein product, partial [Trichobilharzia szidati]
MRAKAQLKLWHGVGRMAGFLRPAPVTWRPMMASNPHQWNYLVPPAIARLLLHNNKWD